jgi:hypothetical protein
LLFFIPHLLEPLSGECDFVPRGFLGLLHAGMWDQNPALRFLEIEGAVVPASSRSLNSSTPTATSGIGRDSGIPKWCPFCRSRIAFPSWRLTAVGNARIASRAAGRNIAGFTEGASQIWDIQSSLAVSMASLSRDGIHPP